MSQETKEQLEKVKKSFEVVKEGAKELVKKTEKIDRDLSEKIKKVQESSEEVVKHIEKKSGWYNSGYDAWTNSSQNQTAPQFSKIS